MAQGSGGCKGFFSGHEKLLQKGVCSPLTAGLWLATVRPMSDDTTLPPSAAKGAGNTRLSPAGQARVQDRHAAMAAALRANLLRRKQQLRGRQDEAAEAAGVTDGLPAEGSVTGGRDGGGETG